ncbi:MAG TPA: hypothetical protein VK929_12970 [Longimicrobiales bacterium]|nr:hypothetical protein [Longimicrobiales bacterium]
MLILGMLVALGLGVYVGLGAPGWKGREDRVVHEGRARRLERRHIHWLRPPNRR